MAPLPIKFQELVQLGNLGVDTQSIGFNSCVSLQHSLHMRVCSCSRPLPDAGAACLSRTC
jgi:hypothetical protein